MKYCHSIIVLICICLVLGGCKSTPPSKTAKRPSIPALDSDELIYQPKEVLPDFIQYVSSRTAPNGLVVSFSNSSEYTFNAGNGTFVEYARSMGGHLDNECFTYDLALIIIYQLLAGNSDHAEMLLTTFEREFYKRKNGHFGLYNAYGADSNLEIGEMTLGVDGDRMHAGPLLWVALGGLNHVKLMRNTRYLEFVLDMVEWCRSDLTYYRFEDGGRGAISMGFGWGPDWSQIFSTEHNIDYFAILKMLRDIWLTSTPEVHEIFKFKGFTLEWINEEMDCIERWLRDVAWDPKENCFNAGVAFGNVDTLKILDGTSWGLEGVGPEYFVSWGIDLDEMIHTAMKRFRAEYELPNGERIVGIDFTDPLGYEHAREPLFWFEGTGQFIIGIQEAARYFERQGDYERAKYYSKIASEYMNDMYLFTTAYNLDGALPYMAIRPGEKEIVKTLKWEWEIPRGSNNTWVKSVSSTMWFAFTNFDKYNPMVWELHDHA